MKNRILVAGIGNLLFTDEGIGVHIIRELSKEDLPEGVELADVGTATFELVSLMEGKDKVVILDGIISNHAPGTVFRLTQDDLKSDKGKSLTSLHHFGVLEALESAAQTGLRPEVVIFGIVPRDYQTPGTELTSQLRRCIPRIVEEILKEIKIEN